jgi:glucose/arabinose dehydrogenase
MAPSRMRAAALCALLAPALAVAQDQQGQPPTPQVVRSVSTPLQIERLAALEFPWGMALLPDGRVLVTEKPGRLRIFVDGKLSEPLAGVPKAFYRPPKDQGGLLDVAVDPKFASNGFVYLSFVEAAEMQAPDQSDTGDTRFRNLDTSDTVLRGGAVARGRLDGNQLRDVQVIWRQVPKTVGRGHFGHRLVFAPDGNLFITSGERMRFEPAQNVRSNLGKVVRIRPDGSIPPDNPFAGQDKAREDIYSLGHRNAIAAAVHPSTGALWVVEMGPLGGDELNLIKPGANYGWPQVSNGDNYDSSVIPDHPAKPQFKAPLRSWTPVISPSGALFYGGAMFPQWRGNLFVGSLSDKAIGRLTLDGTRIVDEERIDMQRRIRDLLEMPDGSLLVLVDDKQGELLRLTAEAAREVR